MNQLIKDNSQRPDIALCRIVFFIKDLRGHVNGASNTCFIGYSGILNDLREAEIAYFKKTIVNKNIGRF